jgi:hypothetical protein
MQENKVDTKALGDFWIFSLAEGQKIHQVAAC